MKNLFQNKISIKEVNQIENYVLEKLNFYDKNCINDKKNTKIVGINFAKNGISITREILNNLEYQNTKRKNNFILNVTGIKFLNKNTNYYEEIPISFSNYQMSFIQTEKPQVFHRTFDIKNIKIEYPIIKKIKIQNPDKEIVEKILKLTEIQKSKLELEDCFEIEYDSKSYYTILDFEDGNYIAVDKNGKVYYLNHDREIRIKQISGNIFEFLEIHKGNKTETQQKVE